jgi:hypothetical protein
MISETYFELLYLRESENLVFPQVFIFTKDFDAHPCCFLKFRFLDEVIEVLASNLLQSVPLQLFAELGCFFHSFLEMKELLKNHKASYGRTSYFACSSNHCT